MRNVLSIKEREAYIQDSLDEEEPTRCGMFDYSNGYTHGYIEALRWVLSDEKPMIVRERKK